MPLLLTLTFALAGCTTDVDHHDDDGHHHDDRGHHHGSSSGNIAYTGMEDVQWTVTGGDPEEYQFSPASLTVQEGHSIGVTFRNNGTVDHEFSIKDFDFHIHLAPGETGQASFVATEEGTYSFGCYIPGHFEAGMKGTLTVTA